MPKYKYKAKKGPGQTVHGELLAETKKSAIAKIDAMGYTPVWVVDQDEMPDEPGGYSTRRVSRRDVSTFTRQLAGLIRSGVPILRALSISRDQSTSKQFAKVLRLIEDDIRDGKMLSEAVSAHPRIFGELFVNMVRAGESAGMLDEILFRLAEAQEKEEDTRKEVQSALAYPSLVLTVGVATVFIMVTFFLPKIADLFRNFSDLPLPTRILIYISDAIRDKWMWVIPPLALVALVFRRLTSGGKGREFIDLMKLSLPVAGQLVLESEIARFARTLSMLVKAGIPVEKALALSASTFNNSVLRSEIDEVRTTAVMHGSSVAAGLRDAAHFPNYARNMIAVGEEGGRIDESLGDVAYFYEKTVERQIKVMTSLIEPVLILVVGAAVGFIAIAMMLPIFAVTRSIIQ